jgi:hypothetical protein
MLSNPGSHDTVILREAEPQRMTPEQFEIERQRLAGGTTFDLDRFRGIVSQVRRGSFLTILLIGALVGGVGFLGGRSWPGRLGWASAALTTAALVIYVAGALAAAFAISIQAPQGMEGVTLLAVDKALEVLESVARDFIGAVTDSAILLLFAGAALSGGVVAWHILARRRGQASGEPSTAPAGATALPEEEEEP